MPLWQSQMQQGRSTHSSGVLARDKVQEQQATEVQVNFVSVCREDEVTRLQARQSYVGQRGVTSDVGALVGAIQLCCNGLEESLVLHYQYTRRVFSSES